MSTADNVLRELEQYGLKQAGAGSWRCNSPFRSGSDSMSFSVTINSPEHGAFIDHHPNANPAKGSLYELARHLNIPLPASVPVQTTKRAYAGIEDYARAHGITGEYLASYNWREVTRSGRPALEFPTHSGTRWRYLDGAKGKAAYTSEDGYKRCWYGQGINLKTMLEKGAPLVLVNGEISVITGRYYGVPTIAMTGGEKAEIPADLLTQLKGFLSDIQPAVKIVVAMDCDKAGRAAGRGLESQLNAAGFTARAVDLALSDGGDLADFAMLHQQNTVAALDALGGIPAVAESSKFHFATIDEVLSMPPVKWLIPGQIPARGLTMLFGASGSFKSFIILDQALKLAMDGTNVIYVAAEGESGYRQRVQAWIQHNKAKPRNVTFVLGSIDLFDPEEPVEFSRLAEIYNPQMIVVDTFAMCSGEADENSGRDMLRIIKACKKMSETLDAVIVVVHHTNAEGKRERGSKTLRNACDTIIRVSLQDDIICVESQKTKDTKAFETYFLAPIQIDLGYTDNTGAPVSSVAMIPANKRVIDQNTLTQNQRRVLEHIAVEPNASFADIMDTCELSTRGVAQRIVEALTKRGYITRNGAMLDVTPAGRLILDGESTESSESTESHTLRVVHGSKNTDSHDSTDSMIQPSQRRLIGGGGSGQYEAGL